MPVFVGEEKQTLCDISSFCFLEILLRFTRISERMSADCNGPGRGVTRAPLLKSRIASSFRDYPPGCGISVSKSLTRISSAVRDYPHGCGIFESESFPSLTEETEFAQETLDQKVNGLEPVKARPPSLLRPPTLDNLYISVNFEPLRKAHGTKDLSHVDVLTSMEGLNMGKYPPRRSVSAVRDFPPLCGKQSSQIQNNDSVKVFASAGSHHVGRVDVGFEENIMKDAGVNCIRSDLKFGNKRDNRSFHRTSKSSGVSPPPCTRSLSGNDDENEKVAIRNKVREALRLFQALCKKLVREAEAKSKECGPAHHLSLYCQAFRVIKEKGKCVNTGRNIIGPVLGVEVGDEFMLRFELNIVGLHRQLQGGIDFVNQGQGILATSIVASGGYDDDTAASDELIYTGSGGNIAYGGKNPEDQKLERGNLALKNSMDSKTPVRVIRGEDTSDGGGKIYVYDGLYLVETYWQERGPHGKLVFKFKLVRMPGQPEVAWKVVKRFRKLEENF